MSDPNKPLQNQQVPVQPNLNQQPNYYQQQNPFTQTPWSTITTTAPQIWQQYNVFNQHLLTPSIVGARYFFYDSSGKLALEIDFDKRDVVCHGSWIITAVHFLTLLKKCLPK